MKTIGFVDYYISEWHANNYPEWIKQVSEKLGEDFVVKYAWAEEYVSPVDGRNTDEWCKEFGVEKCQTIEELCEKADYILVLAPSDPEKHLGYAKAVLKYKKNTYIDKTFAPDYKTAKEIFDIAEGYGTKFFSSSALRYGAELEDVVGGVSMFTQGGGGNMPEYIIHQVEMAVKVLQEKAVKVRVEKQGSNQYICAVEFENGKRATMSYSQGYSFGVCVEGQDGKAKNIPALSNTFNGLIEDILRFYNTGKVSFDTNQTLEVMKIREAIIKGQNELGVWINLREN